MKTLALVLFGLAATVFTSCRFTYHDPLGGKTVVEYDPDVTEKREAWSVLEEALAENLDALTDGATTSNTALVELALSNIERITRAKEELDFEPGELQPA